MTVNERRFIGEGDVISQYENNLVRIVFANGETEDGLEPRRLFPVSNALSYITLLDKDGKEAAIIRSLSDLDSDSRAVVERSLEDYYLVPHILGIISRVEKYGRVHLCVETDRGTKEFDIKNRNHDIRVYDDGRVRIRDSDDNRYIIEDYQKLDKHSKKLLISDL